MLPVLFGKSALQQRCSRMLSSQRLAQGFLFYGEQGLGKKTFAHWFAALLLCEHPVQNAPCGSCHACRSMAKLCHPDFICVEHSGKKGGFSVDTVRKICSSTFVAPNSGSRKVYLFGDCDAMETRTQNLLLKLLEEPPPYAYFLFTASAMDTLLPTIRSRILAFPFLPCAEEECRAALAALGAEQMAELYFPGNIGKNLQYQQEEAMQAAVERCIACLEAWQTHNEYAFLQQTAQIGKDREQAQFLLYQMGLFLRDVIVLHYAPQQACLSCAAALAHRAVRQISVSQALRQMEAVRSAQQALDANVNLQLLLAALCTHAAGA